MDFVTGDQSSELEEGCLHSDDGSPGRCADCDADSFRASQGCTQCAKLMIHRFKGDDMDLENLYKSAKKDLEKYQKLKETSR